MKSSFTGPLRIEEIGYERWAVLEQFAFIYDRTTTIAIPVGFETDLASVPSVLGPVVPKIGYWSQPAVVHDFLYHNHRTGVDTQYSRSFADKVLLAGMKIKAKEYDVPLYLRRDWLIYGGVVAGGEDSWLTPEEKKERDKNSPFIDED